MAIRLIACIDFDTDSVEDAYRELYKTMASTGLNWESSDEWFSDEESTDPADPEVLQAARMKVFGELT